MQPFYDHDGITLYRGNCLEVMPYLINQGITVEATICDPPYGSTACSWDQVIPFVDMWRNVKALNKPKAATVLFGSQPFTSLLIASNIKDFREEIIWKKTIATNFYTLDSRHAKKHENIVLFSDDGTHTYNPQMETGTPYTDKRNRNDKKVGIHGTTTGGRKPIDNDGKRYPSSIQEFSNGNNGNAHPTQKSIELMCYLIRTYTNPGDTVLDFTCGSGTTLLAAKLEGRKCIGIERDTGKDGECLGYCEYAVSRLAQSCMIFV